MILKPTFDRSFLLLFVFVMVAAAGVKGYGQCGVYMRRVSTQQVPYAKVYLDRAADLNGDGKVDLMASQDTVGNDSSRGRILILPGNGDGTFGTTVAIDAATTFDENYWTADVNGDGRPDIIAFTAYSTDPSSMLVYINNGNFSFTPKPSVSSAGMGHPIDFADINGDGKLDYIGAMWNGGQIRYSLGNGDGTFGSPTAINSSGTGIGGDFNGDGKRDFVSSDKNIYFGNGNATFSTFNYGSLLQSGEVVWGVEDMNGDGKSDMLVGGFSASPSLPILTSTGSSFTRADYTVDVAASDTVGTTYVGNFAGNSAPDIVYNYRYPDKKVVYVNDGNGNLTRQNYGQRLMPTGYSRRLTADFNGDGKLDTVAMNSKITNSYPMLTDVTSLTVLLNVCSRPGEPRVVDYDGNGTTDFSFWNPSTGDWSEAANNIFSYGNPAASGTVNWGLGSHGDIPTPGDFDGDGVSDRAVYRDSTGYWYIRRSSDLAWFVFKFGLPGDKPVAADYDGDTITDIAVWRPSDGNWYFWYMGPQQFSALHFGSNGDKPVPADFDGDLKTDVAVYRPSTGVWYYLKSSDGNWAAYAWGVSTDKPIPGDFDGDGKADLAVYRPSNNVAYILRSANQTPAYYQFGLPGDILVIGDYDGDYVADIGLYRPSDNKWWSTTYPFTWTAIYGTSNAVPTSSLYIPQ